MMSLIIADWLKMEDFRMKELSFKFYDNKLSVCLNDCQGVNHRICKVDFEKYKHMRNSEIVKKLEQDILLNMILDDINDGKTQLKESINYCLEMAA